jgi:hypothetical protein
LEILYHALAPFQWTKADVEAKEQRLLRKEFNKTKTGDYEP